jgi:hypothetical protein
MGHRMASHATTRSRRLLATVAVLGISGTAAAVYGVQAANAADGPPRPAASATNGGAPKPGDESGAPKPADQHGAPKPAKPGSGPVPAHGDAPRPADLNGGPAPDPGPGVDSAAWSRCMVSHGVADYPRIDAQLTTGGDPQGARAAWITLAKTPAFQQAQTACEKVMPAARWADGSVG